MYVFPKIVESDKIDIFERFEKTGLIIRHNGDIKAMLTDLETYMIDERIVRTLDYSSLWDEILYVPTVDETRIYLELNTSVSWDYIKLQNFISEVKQVEWVRNHILNETNNTYAVLH